MTTKHLIFLACAYSFLPVGPNRTVLAEETASVSCENVGISAVHIDWIPVLKNIDIQRGPGTDISVAGIQESKAHLSGTAATISVVGPTLGPQDQNKAVVRLECARAGFKVVASFEHDPTLVCAKCIARRPRLELQAVLHTGTVWIEGEWLMRAANSASVDRVQGASGLENAIFPMKFRSRVDISSATTP